jgi:AraC-like DNA-binding protein/TolB-like protein/tetratricopeptide (TPR) repeat protein
MTEPLSTDQIFIKKLTDIVLANLQNEKFGVKELAHESKMSFYRLNRRLHSINKKSTNQFIREIRLNKALVMLRDETSTVAEIAYRVGFGSPSYFNKCFHEFFGYPPGEAKKGAVISRDQNILTNDSSQNESKKPEWRTNILTFPRILLVVLFLGTAGFLIYRKIFRSEWTDNLISSDGRISIAVMPFRNMTNDTTWNIWQDNIQQSLISSFSNYKELKVRQKETVNTLLETKGITGFADLTPLIAGKISLKVEANIFVYGTILKAGSTIRLDAQLIRTRTDEVLKSFEINGPSREEVIFALTDSLRSEIIDFLLISNILKKNPVWDAAYEKEPLTTTSPEALRFVIYGNKSKDIQTEISWYLKALEIDSNYFDPMMGLSTAYSQLGKMEENLKWVIKYYNKRNQWPLVQQLWATWAYSYSFLQPEEGIKTLNQLSQIDDKNANIFYLLGMTYYFRGEYYTAIPYLEKFYELDRNLGEEFIKINSNYNLLCPSYHRTGQFKKEKWLLKEWERNIPDDPEIIFRRAILAFGEKDTIAAHGFIKKYMFAKEIKSASDADVALGLGDIFAQSGMPDKAAESYYKALLSEPRNTYLLKHYAVFLSSNKRDPDEFNRVIDTAISLATNNYDFCDCLDTKGWGLYQFGKHQDALKTLQYAWDSARFKMYFIKSHLDIVKKTTVIQN